MSAIESVMRESRVFPPPAEFVAQANVKKADFERLNAEAAADYTGFWAKQARETLLWHRPFTKALDESNAPFYKWFEDGTLNVSYNCLERNLQNGNADKVAILFESDDGKATKVTYQDLYHRVCRFANALKSLGIKKADRAIIYMPMSVEGVVAMQACPRIGATHSVGIGGLSAKSLQERIIDAGAAAVVTAADQAPGGRRNRNRFRRRADVSRRRTVLEDHPGPQGQRVLHRADGNPFAHQGIRGQSHHGAEKLRSFEPAFARHRRRADQSGSVDVVPRQCRRWPLPDCRYVVADGNRRASDHAAAWRNDHGTRLLLGAAARNHGRDRR